MNLRMRHQRCQGGFTVSEVVLAVGVVAFGLVAVLGVLPAGLSVHKDNREETIIRYEARYWINALRAGAQRFDALDQVEWAEVVVTNSVPPTIITNVYRAHRNRLGGDDEGDFPNLIGALNRGGLKQTTWPTDVIGWLSIPNNGTVMTKTVLVRPMNSTLFDRIYGRKLLVGSSYTNNSSSTIYHPLPGGDLAFAYLLEVSIEEDLVYPDDLHKVKLTFRWPVLKDPTIENPSTPAALNVETISKMVFTTEIAGLLRKADTSYQLGIDAALQPQVVEPLRMKHTVKSILGNVLPGEEVTVDYLEDRILAPRNPMPEGPVVVGQGGDYFIQISEIVTALNFLKGKLIMEELTGSLDAADQSWSMSRQPYSGYGHFSMRPMTGATDDDGGYVPITPWAVPGNWFRGFEPPTSPLPYFPDQYFFTPDNQ